jgi:methionine-rich copper-binding protein CopC
MRNYKIWMMLLFIMSLALLPQASIFAHVSLKESSPENGAAVIEPIDRIVLSFSGGVLPLSTLTVTDAEGGVTSPRETLVEEGRLTAVFAEPLADGAYTVQWKIVSGDGHRLNGSFSFTLDVPEPPVPNGEEANPVPEATTETEPVPEPAESAPGPTAEKTKTGLAGIEPGAFNSYMPFVAGGGLILLGAIVFFLLKPKQHRT